MSVAVEKPPESVLEFGKFLLARVALVPFNVVVENVDGFGFKEFAKFSVLVDHVSKPHFLDVGVNALVSESGIEHGEGEECENFEACRELIELVEEERKG